MIKKMNTIFCFLLSFILFNLLFSCRPSTNTKKENLENKQEVKDTISLVHVESKLDSSSIRNITEVNYLPLPFGDSSTLNFNAVPFNTVMIFEEKNVKLAENIYSFNTYYDFGMNTSLIGNEVIPTFDSSWTPSLFYYDVEMNSEPVTVAYDSVVILKKIKLPNQVVYLGYCGLKQGGEKMIHHTYNLYSCDSSENKIVNSINIYYSISIKYVHRKYKDFTQGFVKKFFYISKSGIISIYYFDYMYAGEGEEYKYLRKEDWIVKKNGKFVRFYEKNGSFKNEEEQGTVKNSMREAKWIEKKPNALVNKPTYLESYFKEGEPINEWKFYDYTNIKKGKLLYTESYENGNLVERKFVE